MKRRQAVVYFLPILLLISISCWSQGRQPSGGAAVRTFYVRGTVRNNDTSQPIEMLKVELKKLTGEVVSTSFTRTNGEFDFSGITNGMYYIVIEEKGYEPVREGVEVFNAPRTGLFIFLRRPLELGSSPPNKTVSARELSIPRKAHDSLQKGADRLYQKNDAKGSLPLFQRAIAELPSYYEAYHLMGVAYLRLGQTAEAEQALRKSIELSEQKYFAPNVDLAAMLSNERRFAEAEPVARLSIELDQNAWNGHYELARALVGLNRVDAAEKSALEARTRNPNFPQLHLLLANIHIRKHEPNALLEDIDTYLKLDPNGPMNSQARQMREQVQRALASAQSKSAPAPPKP